jgi:hypothetical protein
MRIASAEEMAGLTDMLALSLLGGKCTKSLRHAAVLARVVGL